MSVVRSICGCWSSAWLAASEWTAGKHSRVFPFVDDDFAVYDNVWDTFWVNLRVPLGGQCLNMLGIKNNYVGFEPVS